MMVFTHVLMGVLLGAGVATVYPEFLHVAVVTGVVGGGFPDADMVFTHRRTLHFPVLAPAASVAVGGVFLLRPTPVTAGALCFVLAVALHSLTDVLGGGKEMRPWEGTDDRAVYNHVTGTWIRPLRVFYDGSVPDLGLSVGLSAVLLVALPGRYTVLVGVLLVSAVAYTLARRWITRRISSEYRTFSGYIQAKLGLSPDE